MPKNLNPKTKFYLILLAGVLIIAVFVALTFYYIFPRIKNEVTIILDKKRELADLEAKRDQIKSLEESLKKSENDLNTIKSLIVSREEPLEFVEAIYATAETSGFTIKNVTYMRRTLTKEEAKNDKGKPLIYPLLRIAGEGTENRINNFTSLIEHLPYEVEIRNLSATKPNSDDEKVSLSFEISVLNQ